MSTDEAEGYVVFYTAPGAEAGDPVEDKLLRSHEAEAEKQGAEFWNCGKYTEENFIYSKTSKDHLESQINPKTMQVGSLMIDLVEIYGSGKYPTGF